ncbi:fucolectin-6-like [Odontesthes bonariensis]|uniref:fucolectin-6-like n=1 Tax=Odontesthes bonariensis TaxID=219752 RepID=UPI003F58B4F8
MEHAMMFYLVLFLPMYSAYDYPNLALRGKATQSQRYMGKDGDSFSAAYNAIDGNRNSKFDRGTCTHTAEQTNPWWRVDLLESYVITAIKITNRGDCCGNRINGAEIYVGTSKDYNGPNSRRVATIAAIPDGATESIPLTDEVEGRYVNVVLPGSKKILTLCEVEVYGYQAPIANLALRGKATQSQRYNNADAGVFAAAYNAIDGNQNSIFIHGSCTHTLEQTSPWWRVDLLESYVITSIKITNRGDCCGNRIAGAEIYVGSSKDYNGPDSQRVATIAGIPDGGTHTITLSDGVEGRYVTVVIPGSNKILSLCEVEVYGFNARTGKA